MVSWGSMTNSWRTSRTIRSWARWSAVGDCAVADARPNASITIMFHTKTLFIGIFLLVEVNAGEVAEFVSMTFLKALLSDVKINSERCVDLAARSVCRRGRKTHRRVRMHQS